MPKGKANKRYTPEFKIKVVETMQKEKLIYREAAQQFDISDHHNVARWERIYLEKGSDGLRIERRGRKSTGREPKLKKKVEEDLIAEVQRLRAENCILILIGTTTSASSLSLTVCLPLNTGSKLHRKATKISLSRFA